MLDTIYQGIVTKTARPDRINEIKQAVKDATNEYHTLAHFERDIVTGVLIVGAQNHGTQNLREHIPNLRNVMAVLLPDNTKLQKLSLEDGNSAKGYRIIGSTVSFNPPNLSQRYTIMYSIVPTPENSWIVKYYPEAIVSLASMKVAGLTGNRGLYSVLAAEVGQIFPARSGYKHKIMMENAAYEPDF